MHCRVAFFIISSCILPVVVHIALLIYDSLYFLFFSPPFCGLRRFFGVITTAPEPGALTPAPAPMVEPTAAPSGGVATGHGHGGMMMMMGAALMTTLVVSTAMTAWIV